MKILDRDYRDNPTNNVLGCYYYFSQNCNFEFLRCLFILPKVLGEIVTHSGFLEFRPFFLMYLVCRREEGWSHKQLLLLLFQIWDATLQEGSTPCLDSEGSIKFLNPMIFDQLFL